MKYKWIFFDADDTLFDFKKSARHAMSETISHFKISPPDDYYATYKTINAEAWAAFERNEITAQELRFVRFDRFLKAIGEYRDPLEMNSYYLFRLSQTDFMIDGARILIEELLIKKYRLCLITNGLKEVQRPRIAKAGVEHYFEGIVVSDEIGVAKPHAGFFEHAFSETGKPDKEEVIVVGDSLNSDVQGGNNFGLDTCWFNPQGNENITQHKPTFEIKKLEQLKELV